MSEVGVPNELNLLFRLNYESLVSGKYTAASLEREIGTTVKEIKGKLHIDLSNANISDGEILGRIADPCKGAYLAVLERYTTELNTPNPVFDLNISTWMSNLDFFIQQHITETDLDITRECIDTRVIIDKLINAYGPDGNSGWDTERINNLQINYLTLLLGLNEAEAETFAEADVDLVNELYDITKCGAINFCPYNQDQNDNLGIVVNELILSNSLNTDAFQSSISSYDYIEIDKLLEEKCPKIACLLEKMQQEDLSDIYCDMIQGFDGESTLNLEFTAESVFGDATTSPPRNGKITIAINQISCEGEHIVDLVGTILHEGIHAHMYKAVFDAGFDFLDPNNYSDIFDTALSVQWKYNQQGEAQHEIMAKTMIDDMANSLQQYFGFAYDLDYFIWIAWQGLQRYGIYVENYNNNDWDYYKGKYEELINIIPDECS